MTRMTSSQEEAGDALRSDEIRDRESAMAMTSKELRSHRWFGVNDLRSFGHRSRIKQLGYSEDDFAGKPVIGIINTYNDISPCHGHFPQRVEEIKRGVFQAGGFPLELPAIGLSENFQKPSTMLYRNLLAMETEELLRSYPIDGAVLMGGCDKTTPGLLMGAISMDVPAVYFPSGPMLSGCWKGQTLGSGSDVWKYWDELRAGNISECEWKGMENGIARSPGHCMTMGTASTMTAIAEVLGFSLPGASSVPAVMTDQSRLAAASGRLAVDAVWNDRTPSTVMSDEAVHNAAVVALAMGGSTNAIIHLVAMGKRAGLGTNNDLFDALATRVPLLANIRPAGKYLMQDFYDAGGILGLLNRLKSLLYLEAPIITGGTLGDSVVDAEVHDNEIIRGIDNPVSTVPALRVLRGNLCPDGAVIKPASMDPEKMTHVGSALVFDSYREYKEQIDDPTLDVDENTVLILRGSGPVGAPGMPEWGMMPLPKKLVENGVRDMVRISDARMSGTSYGTCILHVAPESAVGGPLAAVRTGDRIELDVAAGTINAMVGDDEWANRLEQIMPAELGHERGYLGLYRRHVNQADQGCDFDFLAGIGNPEPEIL